MRFANDRMAALSVALTMARDSAISDRLDADAIAAACPSEQTAKVGTANPPSAPAAPASTDPSPVVALAPVAPASALPMYARLSAPASALPMYGTPPLAPPRPVLPPVPL